MMPYAHFLCRSGLSILKCDEWLWWEIEGRGLSAVSMMLWMRSTDCSVVPPRCGYEVPWSLRDDCAIVFGRWGWWWRGVQRGLVYQLHGNTLSKALCVPTSAAVSLVHDSHIPLWSPMMPPAPRQSSPGTGDVLTDEDRWGFGSKHISMCLWAGPTYC